MSRQCPNRLDRQDWTVAERRKCLTHQVTAWRPGNRVHIPTGGIACGPVGAVVSPGTIAVCVCVCFNLMIVLHDDLFLSGNRLLCASSEPSRVRIEEQRNDEHPSSWPVELWSEEPCRQPHSFHWLHFFTTGFAPLASRDSQQYHALTSPELSRCCMC